MGTVNRFGYTGNDTTKSYPTEQQHINKKSV